MAATNDTQDVPFDDLRIGNVIYSNDQLKSGTITAIHSEFHQVTLEDGTTPALGDTITIRKRD